MASRKPLVALNGAAVELPAADTLATGLRIEKYTATVAGGAGVASASFAPAFKAAPVAFVVEGWSGQQMVCGSVTGTTASGFTAQVMISQATVLLSGTPFTTAPNGTVVNIIAIGV
ncbi:hypothetical protein [Methylobacterium sp. WL19]|uniref:hypothetical protein n=1 Tax=Methylobacterium sp. WL19 TaxID=2603896 RepID=UPI0011C98435|nr:hypothetical protein [Methylobacterium sp. WL19]TXN33882.1 hypothetical protein FV220_00065 [Methylobacterium sp. WL19]